MSRLQDAFLNNKAFIPFITCGDPSLNITIELVKEMEKQGADCIELGIPFSDPTAEGPTIQQASLRALEAGASTDKIFDAVIEMRKEVKIPLAFMTYANVVYSYGIERFVSKCKEVGIDGLLLPDVPYEEKEEFSIICEQYGIDFVSFIAPTSKNRIEMIAKEAKGYIYIVSSLGVTGVRSSISTDISNIVKIIKENTDVPCAVGFGISTEEQAKKMCKDADGVIVGSAIVKLIGQYKEDCVPIVGEYVKRMKTAITNV